MSDWSDLPEYLGWSLPVKRCASCNKLNILEYNKETWQWECDGNCTSLEFHGEKNDHSN